METKVYFMLFRGFEVEHLYKSFQSKSSEKQVLQSKLIMDHQ